MKTAVRYYTQTGNTKKLAAAAGIPVSEREFHCRGSFRALHRGHPDESDLRAVRSFAREIIAREN